MTGLGRRMGGTPGWDVSRRGSRRRSRGTIRMVTTPGTGTLWPPPHRRARPVRVPRAPAGGARPPGGSARAPGPAPPVSAAGSPGSPSGAGPAAPRGGRGRAADGQPAGRRLGGRRQETGQEGRQGRQEGGPPPKAPSGRAARRAAQAAAAAPSVAPPGAVPGAGPGLLADLRLARECRSARPGRWHARRSRGPTAPRLTVGPRAVRRATEIRAGPVSPNSVPSGRTGGSASRSGTAVQDRPGAQPGRGPGLRRVPS